MLLLTWNLGKNEQALDLVLTYLGRLTASQTVLASLQELPDPIPPSLHPVALAAAGLHAGAPILARRRALFVHSSNLACVASWNVAEDRMQIARWRLDSGTEFFAAGIHAIDRRNHSVPEVRGAYAALTRHALDEQWSDGVPLLLLGDFNAWHDSPEVAHRACLFGVSSSYEHPPRNDTFFGRKSPPLFRVEPTPTGPRGTYFDSDTCMWRDVDHVYVSKSLHGGARASRLASMGQESLVTRTGRPSVARLSDHLPVEATVALT
jgi:endonuclease/exonuclease/phosphatase family metal-dependent hydrolase